jgi:hypothetical protein
MFWYYSCINIVCDNFIFSPKEGIMIAKVFAVLILSLVCMFTPWNTLLAQEIAVNQAQAVVIPGMSIEVTHDLDFGSVIPGVNKTVDKIKASSAGEWLIMGIPNAEIDVTFILPNSLKAIDGDDALPVEFKITDASYSDNSKGGQQIPTGILNPYQVSTIQINPNGTLGIWLGGKVIPGPVQVSGLYTGSIILTAAYTGN